MSYDDFKKKHIDSRIFGGLYTRFKSHDRAASAITVENAVSIEPVNVVEHGLVPSFGRADEDGEVVGTMGRRSYVEYGVYRSNLLYSPHRAQRHFIQPDDLAEFWRGLIHGAEYTRSSARPSVHLRRIVVWVYEDRFPSGVTEARLRDLVQVRQGGESWDQIEFDVGAAPAGVTRVDWIDGVVSGGKLPADPKVRWVASAFWEVVDSNPNGDPDNGGAPRERSDGRGVISYEAIKRWIREFLAAEGHALAMPRGGDIAAIQDAYVPVEDRKAPKAKPKGKASKADAAASGDTATAGGSDA